MKKPFRNRFKGIRKLFTCAIPSNKQDEEKEIPRQPRSDNITGDNPLIPVKDQSSKIHISVDGAARQINNIDPIIECVTIKVLAITDYSVYKIKMDEHGNNSKKATSWIKWYIKGVFEIVNEYFRAIDSNKYRYKIELNELMILKTREESWYTELQDPNVNPEKSFGDKVLNSMEELLKKKTYDAAVTFTLYDGVIDRDKGVRGYAIYNKLCTRRAHALVKISENERITASFVAHEMGHIFGAPHDDDYDDLEVCHLIMNTSIGDFSNYKFSNKSIEHMDDKITKLKNERRINTSTVRSDTISLQELKKTLKTLFLFEAFKLT